MACAIALTSAGVAAAAPYSVSGSVVDAISAEKVAGASCSFYLATDTVKPVMTTMTDADGVFSVSLSRPDSYLLKVSYLGMESINRAFSLSTEKPTAELGVIPLQPAAEQLQEVVVVGRRPVIEASGEKVTYNIDEDPTSGTSTAIEMLRKVPLVTVDAQDNIQVNGSSNFKIYVNGKENPMLTANASQILKSFPASSIKKIEVILEPGAKYDAEGAAGILNIVTLGKQSVDGYMATVRLGASNTDANASIYARTKVNKVTASADFSYYKNYSGREGDAELENSILTGPEPLTTVSRYRTSNRNDFMEGALDFSWEPDTLNLFTLNVSGMGGSGHNYMTHSISSTYRAGEFLNSYGNDHSGKWTWSSIVANAAYQHNFNMEGHNLVLSYQYNYGLSKNNDWVYYFDPVNYEIAHPWTFNYVSSPSNEHTVQFDYTNPFSAYFKLEAGLKGIFRRNSSDGYNKIGPDRDQMTMVEDNFVKLKQYQDVAAAYASYSGTFGKFGVKAGLRYEYTHMGVDFKTPGYDNYSTDLNDWVPNAALSYTITPAQTLHLSYQMRIRRPSVDELNPHESEVMPGIVFRGNPDLTSEKNHTVALNYSRFQGKLGISLRLSGTFCNNRIGSIYSAIGDDIYSTYNNVGKTQDGSLTAFFRYQFSQKLDASLSATARYSHFKFKEENLGNHGWTCNLNANLNYQMPWKLRLGVYAGYSSRRYDLQGWNSGFDYHGIGLTRKFLKEDRLEIGVNARNFLHTSVRFKGYSKSSSSLVRMNFKVPLWSVGFSVSYTLGGLQSDVKKTATSIENDDVNSGNRGGGGAGVTGR